MTSIPLDAQGLAQYRWKNRLLLLFSPSLESTIAGEQLDHFQEDKPALEDRDLLIFRICPESGFGPSGELDAEQLQWLYDYYRVGKDEFNLLLIGKDGGEKLRSETLIDRQKIYELIDSMPMRRAEMKEKG